MRTIIYARTSTKKQNLESQLNSLLFYVGATPDKVYKEQFTGTQEDRKEWSECKRNLKEGDRLIVLSVNRLSRNAKDGYRTYMNLLHKGVNIEFIMEPHLNTSVLKESLERAEQLPTTGDNTIDPIIEGLKESLKNMAKNLIKLAYEQSEKEANDIKRKVIKGIEYSKNKSGRKKGYKSEKKIELNNKIKKKIKSWEESGYTKKVLAYDLGVSYPTMLKILKEYKEIK
jgi:DNA invertase Pin-like site-specific DNA recombinase